jgi:hypothetical protein
MAQLGLKKRRGYHQTSTCIQLSTKNERVKLYNKTLHPLFACESVFKKIGMGGRQFFLSSSAFYRKHLASESTGRLRIERSTYINSKEEERKFFKKKEDGLFTRICDVIRAQCRDFVRNIPFDAVWDKFWQAPNPYLFTKYSHKLAVVYAYNDETK